MVLLARLVHLRPLKNLLFGHHPGPSSSPSIWPAAVSQQSGCEDGGGVVDSNESIAAKEPRHHPVHWSPLLTVGLQLFHTYYSGGSSVLGRQLGALRLFGNCGLFDGSGNGGYVALGALNVISEGQEKKRTFSSSTSGENSNTQPNNHSSQKFCTDSPLSKKPEAPVTFSIFTDSETSKSQAFPHFGEVYSSCEASHGKDKELLSVSSSNYRVSDIFERFSADFSDPPCEPSHECSKNSASHAHSAQTSAITKQELRCFERKIVARHRANVGLETLLSGDVQGGLSLLRLSAEEDDAEALHNLGVANEKEMFQGATLEEALSLYSRAASLGHWPSVHNMAVFHQKGLGGLKVDGEKARELLEQAKEMEGKQGGEEECQYCKEAGWEEEGGKVAAALEKDDGFYESLYRLARANHLGLGGLPVDCDRALQLYQAAAAGGHKRARRERAAMVATGRRRTTAAVAANVNPLRYSKSAPLLTAVQYAF